MPDPRQAHVVRIQNDHSGQGNPLADGTPPDQVASEDSVWMDVLRLDKVQLPNPYATQGLNQIVNYVFKWQDGPGDHPNTRRKLETIKITNPDNATQWVKIDIIKQMSILRPNANQGVNQTVNFVFDNHEDNTVRQSDVVTISNTDVSSLDMSKPVDWAHYQPVLTSGQQDKSQSLVVEIPNRFKMIDPYASQGLNQTKQIVMKNKDVKAAINQKPPSP